MKKKFTAGLTLTATVLAVLFAIAADYAKADWQTMSSENTSGLSGVWGSSGTDVFAVGNGGTILHYNGNSDGSWSAMENSTA
jgi:hypothetical protein